METLHVAVALLLHLWVIVPVEASGECPPRYYWNAKYRVCWRIPVLKADSWEDGRRICQADGGDLAVMRDRANLVAAISAPIGPITGPPTFYIGGRKLGGVWTWVDGTAGPNPSNDIWATGALTDAVDEDCLMARGSLGVYDTACIWPLFFLCELRK